MQRCCPRSARILPAIPLRLPGHASLHNLMECNFNTGVYNTVVYSTQSRLFSHPSPSFSSIPPYNKEKHHSHQQEQRRTPMMYEIDPEGDVVLVVSKGHSKISIRVSSKVLSVGSEVFHRMLSGQFKEATELAARYVLSITGLRKSVSSNKHFLAQAHTKLLFPTTPQLPCVLSVVCFIMANTQCGVSFPSYLSLSL